MEIRSQVALSSSWGISGDLQNVLFIRNSMTGVPLDEPLSSERSPATPLTLDRPDGDDLCYLNVDLTGLRGYLPSGLELLSESRTIEVYDKQRDEYLDTVRGVMVKTRDGCKLYSCVFDLSSDNIFNNISVKLLSLKGKEHVHLRKLLLDVSEDHGGSREETSSKSSSAYHHQLLSSLASQKLPPLLQGLVSSLQLTSSRDPGSNAPSDLIGMSHALREVHSVLSPPPVNEPTPTTQTTTEEPNIEEPATVSDVTASQPDQDELLSKLEERLKTYIDTKFAELEQKIETRLESIFTDRVNGPPPTLPPEETNCYGLVEDLSQLD